MLIALSSYSLRAQNKKQLKAAEIKSLVDSKNFTFMAQYADPLGGGHRYLTSDYDVVIKPDSVNSYLPYFGRVTFDPPIYPTQDGIMFKSTKFGYQTTVKKNGMYLITITPTDAKYIQKLYLTVSPNGYASLQVTITNRDAISYDGFVTATPSKKAADNSQQTAKTK